MEVGPGNANRRAMGGLARDVFMWLDMTPAGKRSGASLLQHLGRLGRTAPDWLCKECDKGHLAKGDRAAIVYRAMLDAAPEPHHHCTQEPKP